MAEEEAKPAKGTDYTKKVKKPRDADAPEMEITKVVSGPVAVKKQNLGGKIKEMFVAADIKSVMHYVGYEIVVPAIRSLIVDGASRGVERAVFGESRYRRPMSGPGGPGIMSRITYNAPVQRGQDEGYRDPRTAPPTRGPALPRAGRSDFVFTTKQDADLVLDAMYNIYEVYEYVTVAQVNELVGLHSAHTDEKWGWTDLRGADVKQDKTGWWLDLPNAQPL